MTKERLTRQQISQPSFWIITGRRVVSILSIKNVPLIQPREPLDDGPLQYFSAFLILLG
ncbi:unnamed protein product [Acanthoscelides obtectus]|uniref:Uncharacterized protein n=1 Tax=Acanthoscelides obtectus TaxID=200917 RepID=A0A9P0LWU4_ACAOB|nr:unnamed protein product [Acanthoscelides obtectus]CAK1678409.1 hypothetical protein AOBTE_LOCUS31879 [Acanthoscelides obtectus]